MKNVNDNVKARILSEVSIALDKIEQKPWGSKKEMKIVVSIPFVDSCPSFAFQIDVIEETLTEIKERSWVSIEQDELK